VLISFFVWFPFCARHKTTLFCSGGSLLPLGFCFVKLCSLSYVIN